MFFIKDTYATVWQVEDKGNYLGGRISTSEKDQNGEYVNSNWFVAFFGKAKEKAVGVSERTRIKILSGKVTNVMKGEGENKKSYLNVAIFDFEFSDATPNSSPPKQQPTVEDNYEDDEIPF